MAAQVPGPTGPVTQKHQIVKVGLQFGPRLARFGPKTLRPGNISQVKGIVLGKVAGAPCPGGIMFGRDPVYE